MSSFISPHKSTCSCTPTFFIQSLTSIQPEAAETRLHCNLDWKLQERRAFLKLGCNVMQNCLIILNFVQGRMQWRVALWSSFKVAIEECCFGTVLLDFLTVHLTWEIIKSEPMGRGPVQAWRQAHQEDGERPGILTHHMAAAPWRGEATLCWEVFRNGNLMLVSFSALSTSISSDSPAYRHTETNVAACTHPHLD